MPMWQNTLTTNRDGESFSENPFNFIRDTWPLYPIFKWGKNNLWGTKTTMFTDLAFSLQKDCGKLFDELLGEYLGKEVEVEARFFDWKKIIYWTLVQKSTIPFERTDVGWHHCLIMDWTEEVDCLGYTNLREWFRIRLDPLAGVKRVKNNTTRRTDGIIFD